MTLRPRLRADLVIVEQNYRDVQSFIVKDAQAHKYYRFRPLEIAVMQEFDGELGPEQIAEHLKEQGLPVSAAAVEGFARKLKQMELLERSLAERSVLQLERLRADRRRRLTGAAYQGSLLRMRWSVGDPNAMFDRWLPRLRFFFSPAFLVLSVALFLAYGVVTVLKWPDLAQAIVGLYTFSGYTPGRLFLLWLTAMGIIVVHELGHGFTCKYFGGQVHEMGAMLIYFEPAFYCNVNDAWTFPERSHRLWVTVAGPWIQLVLAGVAAVVWWAAAPGTVASEIALSAVLIGGITTVVANANPLIPLDGYYALSDYLEIPNLRQRALGYFAWQIKRYLLRLEVPEPAATPSERRVFLIYGVLSALYSSAILIAFVGFMFGWVGRKLGALGLVAFTALVVSSLRKPVVTWTQALVTAVREHRAFWQGPRLRQTAALGVLALLGLGLVVPWPITVQGSFVTRAPATTVSVAEPGVVERVYVREGDVVPAGALIADLQSLELQRQAVELKWWTDSMDALATAARAAGRLGETRRLEEERGQQAALLEGLRGRLAQLRLRAPRPGLVVTPRVQELMGRWVPRGTALVRLVDGDSIEARMTLEGPGAVLVRPGLPVRLIAYAETGRPLEASVTEVSTTAVGEGARPLEVRIRLPGRPELRPGLTGEARVEVRRSNLLGALWWTIRRQFRSDLLL